MCAWSKDQRTAVLEQKSYKRPVFLLKRVGYRLLRSFQILLIITKIIIMKKYIIITFAVLFCNIIFAQTKFTIPVVVHVISPSTTPIVTAKEVQDAIKNLNLQFKGLYAKTNKSGIIAPYQNSISSFENIQFKLATLDVNNKPTTGINFIKNATWSNNASDNEAIFKKQKQWDRTRYMNLYIVANLNAGNQSGVAYLPTEVSSATWSYLDGVLVDYNILPNTLPLQGASRWTEGYEGVLAHEVGHYLSLKHTMGEVNGSATSCNDPLVVAGDEVADTPRHYNDMYQISKDASEAERTVINCDNKPVMIDNFMCYSKTQRMFSAGQVQRVTNALNSSLAGRNNLWKATNLTATGLSNDTQAPTAVTNLIFSNVTNTSLTLSWTAATDNQAVLGYDIYKNGVYFATTIENSYKITGLTANAITTFTIKTRDFDSNISPESAAKSTTPIYCAAAGITEPSTIEWIKSVKINTLNYSSTDKTTHYHDYSAQNTSLVKGQTYPLTVKLDDFYNDDEDHTYIVAWIDWNKNFTFDANEKYTITPQFMTTTSVTLSIQVPITATTGAVRMRIRSVWNDTNTLTDFAPCGNETYGEVEDYTLNVSAAAVVAGRISNQNISNSLENVTIMSVFPNPSNGLVNIKLSTNDATEVEIFDFSGRIILSKTIQEGNSEIDLSDFMKGIYFAKAKKMGVVPVKILVQ